MNRLNHENKPNLGVWLRYSLSIMMVLVTVLPIHAPVIEYNQQQLALPIFANAAQAAPEMAQSIAPQAPTATTGTVFRDYDNDGAIDAGEPGVGGITVTAYAANGSSAGSATTVADGSYSFTPSGVGPYRIEFTGLPSYLQPSVAGTDSATSVQFVADGNASNVNFAVHNPAEYCQENPIYGVSCYTNGDPLDSSNFNEPAVALLEYLDRSETSANSKQSHTDMEDVGSVYGLAYARNTGNLYMSTVLKRHSGVGPNGLGAIYVQTDYLDDNSVSLFYDFGAVVGTVDNNATRFPGTGTGFGQEGPCRGCDNVDANTYPIIGTRGMGDIDVSEDDSTLHVVNLFDRNVYAVDLPNGTGHTMLANAPWTTGDICGGTGTARPWGLKNYEGKTYVGVVCDGTSSACTAAGGACSDLTAHVYSHDGTSWANEISFPLDYERSLYNTAASDYWHRWSMDYTEIKSYIDNNTDAQYPQPILADIEFDADGSMILGFFDRSSLQFGYAAPDPTDNSSDISVRYFSAGDMLRVGFDNSGTPSAHSTTYQLENNGTVNQADGTTLTGTSGVSPAGPGGREFYADEWTGIGAGNKSDSLMGVLALKPGSGEILTTASDAFQYYGAGTMFHSNTDGEMVGGVQVFVSNYDASNGTVAKAGGLGDIELFCEAASIEVGNRVWEDSDGDGIQDAGEPAIANVTVELYQGGSLVGTAITDANGNFYFNNSNVTGGVLPNTAYEIRVSTTQPAILPYSGPSPANVGGTSDINDQSQTANLSDSNGVLSGTTAVISLTTGNPGANNHTYDFGFVTTSLSLGDLLWDDLDNDGIQDAGEAGFVGVTVEVHTTSGTVVDTTTTNGSGRYLFTGLPQGQYIVHIPASNFQGGGVLNGLYSSNPTEIDPNTNINDDNQTGAVGDDNGINEVQPAVNGISSGVVTLSDDDEPTGDDHTGIDSATDDEDSNLTVDFGFNSTPPPIVELGNLVWLDADNDGIFDGGESGIGNVTVELYLDGMTPGSSSPVRTTTTAGGGLYTFTNLTPGSYFVYIPATEFQGGGELENMRSSMTTTANPNNDLDDNNGSGGGDDNGLDDAAAATNGIRTGVIVLDEDTEPTGDDTGSNTLPDADANMTLDLGFFTPLALGNFVWQDLDSDGTQNEGIAEGLSGRTVELFLGNGVTPATDVDGNTVSSVLTDGNGNYTFTNLPPGEYVVRVDLPTGFTPTTGGADPDSNSSNNDSNGVQSGNYAVSPPVTLTSGGEPTDDGDSDPNTNLSIDFGLVATPDINLDKTLSPSGQVSGGETINYTVQIQNTGYVTLTNVAITDTLPAGLSHVGGSTNITYWSEGGSGSGSSEIIDNFSSNNLSGGNGWDGAWSETGGDAGTISVSGSQISYDASSISGSYDVTLERSFTAPAGVTAATLYITTTGSWNANSSEAKLNIEVHDGTSWRLVGELETNGVGGGNKNFIHNVSYNIASDLASAGTKQIRIVTAEDGHLNGSWSAMPANMPFIDEVRVVHDGTVSSGPGYVTESGSAPPALTGANTYTIPIGRFITATYQVQVDSPIAGGVLEFVNEVEVRTDQMEPMTDTATLPVAGSFDYGDLPNTYGTTSASSGATHQLDGATFLGSRVDAESDGVPSNAANGDDNAGSDDEDGVVFLTPIVAGRPFTVQITAGSDGVLNAWIDYNADGTLTQIESETALAQGVHTRSYTAPANAPSNITVNSTMYSRFRFTAGTGQATSATGSATSGEVEDYALLAIGDTVWLDVDADGVQDGGGEVGIQNVVINLLDSNGLPVTDGVGKAITTTTDSSGNYGFGGLPAGNYIIEVATSNWNAGNVFGAGGSHEGAVGSPGQGGDDQNNTDDNGNNDSGGLGTGIQSGVINLSLGSEPDANGNADLSIDFGLFQANEFGDLPAGYGTTVSAGGAGHVNTGTASLGASVDNESDGVPSNAANGDDTANSADEDGVQFLTPLTAGNKAIIQVTTNVAGYLNGWIDFDGDGTLDAINLAAVGGTPQGGTLNDLSLAAGTYTMTIVVPANATINNTIYSRFRHTTNDPAGTLGTTGSWPNGEVEDYALLVLGDTVWFDWDNAGDQDATEPKLSGVLMNLLDGSGNPITDAEGNAIQTTTDVSGTYTFAGLPAGNYIVEIAYSNWDVGGIFGPAGAREGAQSTNGAGGDDGNNSDDNGRNTSGADGSTVTITNTIRSGVIALALGEENDVNGNGDLSVDFGLFVAQYDYGDLPNRYGTTNTENGARHLQTSTTYLGAGIDLEVDGLPTADATGDNVYTTTVTLSDDEDGVEFSAMSPGRTAIITVTAGTAGYLSAWIDFDADGTLDAVSVASGPGAGGSLNDVNLSAGVHAITVNVPSTTTTTSTIYSRFRFTENAGEATTTLGTANSGEVEDYALAALGDRVWYDVSNDGVQDAGEIGIAGVLVNLLDGSGNPVRDGSGAPIQATTNATGTYGFAGLPDGNYIIQIDPSNWNASNVFGAGGQYEDAYSVPGVGADDGNNGDDNGDNDGVVAPAGGARSSVIALAIGTEPTDDGDSDPTSSPNTDLSVDFGFFYDSHDWGDLPNAGVGGAYNTTAADGGPSHVIVGGVHLGNTVDAEDDGQPNSVAIGDDTSNTGSSDDEDGVLFFTPLAPGRPAEVRVYANSDGYLSSFIDYDADGTLDTVNYSSLDAITTTSTALNNIALTTGWHTFFIDVPASAVISETMYARFRFTSQSGGATTADGAAPDGEVEDYALGSIGNRVWADLNGDGVQDGGEASIPGVLMELWGVRDAVGSYITTTTNTMTNSEGEYYFGGLPDGRYEVQVHEDNWLAGGVFGPGGAYEGWIGSPGQGGDDQNDTDDNGDNDNGVNLYGDPAIESRTITLTAGIDVNFRDFSVDFGLYPPSTVEAEKILNTPDPVLPGSIITFTIRITNTGMTTITTLPLTDTYDAVYLTFNGGSTTPEAETTGNTGVITWTDLTQAGNHGFGQDLGPGQHFDVVVEFIAALDTSALPNGVTVNNAHVYTHTVTDTVQIFNPTNVVLGTRDVSLETISGEESSEETSEETSQQTVVLTWSTADETDLVGFHLLRLRPDADGTMGDPERLTSDAQIILVEGTSTGADYRFEDVGGDVGDHYVLEMVMVDGTQMVMDLGVVEDDVGVWVVYLPVLRK